MIKSFEKLALCLHALGIFVFDILIIGADSSLVVVDLEVTVSNDPPSHFLNFCMFSAFLAFP